jgi:hypothetical protein
MTKQVWKQNEYLYLYFPDQLLAMKRIISISLSFLVLFASCKEPATTDSKVPGTDTFHLCNTVVHVDTISEAEFGAISQRDFNDTNELKYLLPDAALVRRHADTLAFSIDGGGTALIINETSDTDNASKYLYKGYDKVLNKYVVQGFFYEWWCHLLIGKARGDTTIVCGAPVTSPDGKYFICGNCDIDACFTFNGLELYENTSPPKLVCAREIPYWGPSQVKWHDNKTLYVHANTEDTTGGGFRMVFLRLRLE